MSEREQTDFGRARSADQQRFRCERVKERKAKALEWAREADPPLTFDACAKSLGVDSRYLRYDRQIDPEFREAIELIFSEKNGGLSGHGRSEEQLAREWSQLELLAAYYADHPLKGLKTCLLELQRDEEVDFDMCVDSVFRAKISHPRFKEAIALAEAIRIDSAQEVGMIEAHNPGGRGFATAFRTLFNTFSVDARAVEKEKRGLTLSLPSVGKSPGELASAAVAVSQMLFGRQEPMQIEAEVVRVEPGG